MALDPRDLISDSYRIEQRYLHCEHPKQRKYGTSGKKWIPFIKEIDPMLQCRTVLDYGCGKGNMRTALPEYSVQSYDPALPKFATLPDKADIVVCGDVLEHIEPECIEAVAAHLRSVTLKYLFVSICQRVAGRSLRDGRNAHILIKNSGWWRALFERHGFIVRKQWPSSPPNDPHWIALMEPTC